MVDYPNIRKALEILEHDGGGFHRERTGYHSILVNGVVDYSTGASEIVRKTLELTAKELRLTSIELGQIEVYLGSLDEDDFQTLIIGDVDEAKLLDAPQIVTEFFNTAFEVDIDG